MTSTAAQAPTVTLPEDDFSEETVCTWNNWKGHGRIQQFTYWGSGRNSGPDATNGQVVASVDTSSTSWYRYLNANGELVFQGGVATKFWASPAPAAPQLTGDAKAIQSAARTAKRPSRNGKLHPCLCGCGSGIRGLYGQGHDARHASYIARAIIQLMHADPDANTDDIMAQLPTEALRAKAAAIVAKRIK